MGYAFVAREPISIAVPRIVTEEIERAAHELGAKNRSPATRVHEGRKRFKEIRAVLRMVRGPLGDLFRVENLWHRDAGRDLAAARDIEAVTEALEKLRAKSRSARSRLILAHARRVVASRAPQPGELQARIANTIKQLEEAQTRVSSWPALDDSFDESIGGGIERTYRDGRRAYAAALAHRDPERFHEWRKRVKDLWYHAQLLTPMWPEVLTAHSRSLKSLSDDLGDHHDLIVLQQMIVDEPSEFGNDAGVRTLLNLIGSRIKELEHHAMHKGRRIYAEPPRVWHDRMRAYWEAWQ